MLIQKNQCAPLNFIALFIGNIYSGIDSTKHYSRQHSVLIEIFFMLMENRNIFFVLTRLVSDSGDNSSEVSTTTLQLTFSQDLTTFTLFISLTEWSLSFNRMSLILYTIKSLQPIATFPCDSSLNRMVECSSNNSQGN